MKNFKIFFFVLSLELITVAILVLIADLYVSSVSDNFTDGIVVENIAGRLQVTPSWDAIRTNLFDQFKPGLTRVEVHKILDKVGPWTIDSVNPIDGSWDPNLNQIVFRELIRFKDQNTNAGLSIWDFLYDKNDKLLDQGPVDLY